MIVHKVEPFSSAEPIVNSSALSRKQKTGKKKASMDKTMKKDRKKRKDILLYQRATEEAWVRKMKRASIDLLSKAYLRFPVPGFQRHDWSTYLTETLNDTIGRHTLFENDTRWTKTNRTEEVHILQ